MLTPKTASVSAWPKHWKGRACATDTADSGRKKAANRLVVRGGLAIYGRGLSTSSHSGSNLPPAPPKSQPNKNTTARRRRGVAW